MAKSKLVSLSDPSSWATKAHVAGGGGQAAGAGAASAAPAAAEEGDAALLAGARERKGTLSLKAVHAASPAPTRRQAQGRFGEQTAFERRSACVTSRPLSPRVVHLRSTPKGTRN